MSHLYLASLLAPITKPGREVLKRLTTRIRITPNFLIIGVERGGTTSLYIYLTAHPCMARAALKEVHFFDLNFGKGMDW